ncbi:MAG: hypothetical protein F6J86_25540 [Symploca sp. SIO1B1]|nr:hypothetical protein [Symploca sp. SIO1B1]
MSTVKLICQGKLVIEDRRQKAEGRRQEAGGKKTCVVSFFILFNWRVIFMPVALGSLFPL